MNGYLTPVINTNETQVYAEDHLIEMVKLRMDEVDQTVKPIVDVGVIDNKPISDIIGGLLHESRLDVLRQSLIDDLPKATKDYTVTNNSIVLENDVLRIVSFSSNEWGRKVASIVDTNSKEYKRQSYSYIKSRKNTPVVVYVDGKTYDVYPTVANVTLTYISSLTKFEDLSERLINALCWNCAVKSFIVMGMMDNAAKAMEIYSLIIK